MYIGNDAIRPRQDVPPGTVGHRRLASTASCVLKRSVHRPALQVIEPESGELSSTTTGYFVSLSLTTAKAGWESDRRKEPDQLSIQPIPPGDLLESDSAV